MVNQALPLKEPVQTEKKRQSWSVGWEEWAKQLPRSSPGLPMPPSGAQPLPGAPPAGPATLVLPTPAHHTHVQKSWAELWAVRSQQDSPTSKHPEPYPAENPVRRSGTSTGFKRGQKMHRLMGQSIPRSYCSADRAASDSLATSPAFREAQKPDLWENQR